MNTTHKLMFAVILAFLFFISPWEKIISFPSQDYSVFPDQKEIAQITTYQNILNNENPTFSRLYTNKLTSIVKNLETNFFETVDLNYYFFANHPLERVGVNETEKLSSLLLPFFILGLFCLNLKKNKILITWILLFFIISSILPNRYYKIDVLLLIPFLLIIGMGMDYVLNRFKQ